MVHSYAPHDDRRPRQVEPRSPADWFETITRAAFNAGMSWSVVEAKWAAIGQVLGDFEPRAVARMDDADVERMASDDRVIRNRGKLRGTIANARTFVDLEDEHGSFPGWLGKLDGYDTRERAVVSAFRYVGDYGAYWILSTTMQEVPEYGQWCRDRGREPPPGA